MVAIARIEPNPPIAALPANVAYMQSGAYDAWETWRMTTRRRSCGHSGVGLQPESGWRAPTAPTPGVILV